MSKTKLKYICSQCGYESLKWIGKCPQCDNWNTFVEEYVETERNKPLTRKKFSDPQKISEIQAHEEERIKSGIAEFDRVLGGGFVKGSIILLGGDPGIGKSTLAMQILAKVHTKTLYVTGEESNRQVKLRAKRLKVDKEEFYVLVETSLNSITQSIENLDPSIVVIDSIQTVYKSDLDNSPGSITQIRECALELMNQAKRNNYAVLLIGHVTKEGNIAGPKILEHIVDTVIQFEGETNNTYRILRAQKNRFGNINEIGVFEMFEEGLKQITNPSELFLSGRGNDISGSVITATIEGTRPILLEVQALVTPSNYGNPQRVATGFDYKRLSILLAVIEKRGNFRLSSFNVFINMAGGVRIDEPAADLAVCCSIISSITDKNVSSKIALVGEVGLGGEIRSVNNLDQRIQETEKLGFDEIIIPYNNLKGIKDRHKIKIKTVDSLKTVINYLF
ncbi:MAG TPA: DNA repair protein RadA [Ignavibacteriaceae bacterium]|nr:DNA repair protein RadA [Ignavibacteriaceae bacterium]